MSVGVARSALPGSLGFDYLGELPDEVLAAGRQNGFVWLGAYLEVLTAEYVARVHSFGYGIHPICEARVVDLDATLGHESALIELGRARNLQIPASVHLVIDLEDTHGTLDNVASYVDAFSEDFDHARFGSELYVAEFQPFDGHQLYHRPWVTRYWSGASRNPEPDCGYTVFQGLPIEYAAPWAAGAKIDMDIIWQDRRGRTPVLWWPS